MIELEVERVKEIKLNKGVSMLEAKRLARKEVMVDLFDKTQFLVLDGGREHYPVILYNILVLLEELIEGEV